MNSGRTGVAARDRANAARNQFAERVSSSCQKLFWTETDLLLRQAQRAALPHRVMCGYVGRYGNSAMVGHCLQCVWVDRDT